MSPILSTAQRCGKTSLRTACRASTKSYSTKNEPTSDPKRETIRKMLYPGNMRNTASPTGTWRPDVGRALQHAIPSVQAHETIERAWLLHKRRLRQQRDAELTRKFECMRAAMDELEKLDNRLYMEANKTEDPRRRTDPEVEAGKKMREIEKQALEARARGLFPRELKIPTETPSRSGWNYDWKPFPRPL